MTRISSVVLIASLFLTSAVSGGELSDLLRARQAKLDGVLATDTTDMTIEQRRRVSDVLAEMLDFRSMAEGALGKAWQEHDEAARAEFVTAFERLVRANWMKTVDVYRSDGVEYIDETLDGDTGRVTTTIATAESLTEVDYRFLRAEAVWRIVDYAIDGVSAVRNYRAQFRKILKKETWETLLERIRSRAETLETEL